MVVPGWGGETARLTFGIEQEQFAFRLDGTPPTREDCLAVLDALLARGMTPGARDEHGDLVTVWRETPTGPLTMKNDFCSHIFEVSYPPARRVDEFVALYREAQDLAQAALATRGIRLRTGGALAHLPARPLFRPSDSDKTWGRIQAYLTRPVPRRPFSHRLFFAGMCSTQIHLNILAADFYPRLPALYGVEHLVPLLYSVSPVFNGRRAHCVRPLMYRDGFSEAYRTNCIPRPIPRTTDEYTALRAASKGFLRDYTFIAPSRHGTVEFRAACSQPTVADIVELLALRVAMTVGVWRGYWRARAPERFFWDACLSGEVPEAILAEDADALTRAQPELPDDLRAPLDGALRRLARAGMRRAA